MIRLQSESRPPGLQEGWQIPPCLRNQVGRRSGSAGRRHQRRVERVGSVIFRDRREPVRVFPRGLGRVSATGAIRSRGDRNKTLYHRVKSVWTETSMRQNKLRMRYDRRPTVLVSAASQCRNRHTRKVHVEYLYRNSRSAASRVDTLLQFVRRAGQRGQEGRWVYRTENVA